MWIIKNLDLGATRTTREHCHPTATQGLSRLPETCQGGVDGLRRLAVVLPEHGLLVASKALPRSIALDVLDEHAAAIYWARSDRFGTVLDLSFAQTAGPGTGAPPLPTQ
jgi:hypothetical protein